MAKNMIARQVDTLDVSYVTLSSVKAKIDYLITQFGGDATLQLEQVSYCTSYEVNVYAKSEETDGEYAARLKSEAYYAGIREKKEREEFERLSAKFGAKQ